MQFLCPSQTIYVFTLGELYIQHHTDKSGVLIKQEGTENMSWNYHFKNLDVDNAQYPQTFTLVYFKAVYAKYNRTYLERIIER